MHNETLAKFKAYILKLTHQEGPLEVDYFPLTEWLFRVNAEGITKEHFREVFPPVFWSTNKQPRSLLNRAYIAGRVVGSYDIMQDLYSNYVNPHLSTLEKRWDIYIQSQASVVAVRHRLQELQHTLQEINGERILDVACGSGVGVPVIQHLSSPFHYRYTGVDSDPAAIQFCEKTYEDVPWCKFLKTTILDLTPKKANLGTFDLVWCSGLFDYFFTDLAFVNGVKRLLKMSRQRVVIGNMGPANPNIPLMNVCGWHLAYRSRQELAEIALRIYEDDPKSFSEFQITSDPTGIQHYLHFQK